jgi:hypothetical protein
MRKEKPTITKQVIEEMWGHIFKVVFPLTLLVILSLIITIIIIIFLV